MLTKKEPPEGEATVNTLVRISLLTTVTGLLASMPTSSAATSPTSPDLAQSYLFTPAGRLTPLRVGVTYHASQFPLAIRLTPPAPGWSGTQWRSGTDYFRGGAPPNYGWVHMGRGSASGIPQGLISIMTAYTATPSLASTVNVLRSRGRGATYQPSTQITLAGYHGIQFDGQIVGAKNVDHTGHFFVPFSPPSHAARYYPDEYPVYGDVFRVIVLDVHGKTVVVYIENVALPPSQFPSFLTKATAILKATRFRR
jgi:hypothetical protein